MNNSQENDTIEIKHYIQIVEYFEEENDQVNREIFRDKYLSNLMSQLKQDPETQNIVKNAIVIMNVLIDENKPPDRFNEIGLSKEQLTKKDVKILKKKLKKLVAF